MKNTKIDVSIVLVTYNRPDGLKKSIEDIRNQSFKNFELIICDDASPDLKTIHIGEYFAAIDERITYYRQDKNLGMPGNLNFGLRKAKGEYIVILHDGDRFHTKLIEKWYNGISQNPGVGLCFTSLAYLDKSHNVVHKDLHFRNSGIKSGKKILRQKYFRSPLMSSIIWGEVMIRRTILEQINFLDTQYSFWADVDAWMKVLDKYDAFYTAEALICMFPRHLQSNEFTTNQTDKFFMFLSMFKKHRKSHFKDCPIRLFLEMLLFYCFGIYGFFYIGLINIKHKGYDGLLYHNKSMWKNKQYIFLPFTILLYPVLIFTNLKFKR